MGVIKNNNEISTHPTFHTSLEYYMNDYLPIRMGLDHNRYTLGTGLYLDPFEIDIALAQSRDPIIDHQLTIGFSYGLEEKNNLYWVVHFCLLIKKMIPFYPWMNN